MVPLECVISRQAFDTMKQEFQFVRQKNADRQRKVIKDDGISLKAVPLIKRELYPASECNYTYVFSE